MKIVDGGKDKTDKVQPLHDWEAIENDLTTTTISIRAIGRKHGISDTAIRKHIKKNGIQRDLTLKVKAATRNKLVRNPVRKTTKVRIDPKNQLQTKTEKEIVEAAAEQNISFIHAWDKIFLETVETAKRLKKEIFKKVKIKIPAKPAMGDKPATRAKTITADKLDPKERATVFNSIVKAETGVFEAMRKNLGIDDSGGQEAPALLMDYGTGDYDKELERRKAGTDSV